MTPRETAHLEPETTPTDHMAKSFTTFLMFEGAAEEALNLYTGVFPDAEITHLERFGPGEPGPDGTIKAAELMLGDHRLRFFDSFIQHDFTFTPSISIFVECESEAELETAYAQLSEGGTVAMPLDNYGFSTRFGWVNDRFGVSWQLNLQ
jgi:predicted 3-demethylubiquinone-9 3-methyltransferase (glyoxalase superfamily)